VKPVIPSSGRFAFSAADLLKEHDVLRAPACLPHGFRAHLKGGSTDIKAWNLHSFDRAPLSASPVVILRGERDGKKGNATTLNNQ
jgi:hypothetical protein